MKTTLANQLQQITEQNLADIEEAKQAGRSVIGFYCLYSPTEIAVAADAIPLPLCGTRNDPIGAAEEILPRNLCPLIKSSFGFAVTDTCPFFRFSDIIVGDTTCDGKKKMFELLSRYKPPMCCNCPKARTRLRPCPSGAPNWNVSKPSSNPGPARSSRRTACARPFAL
jgi:benzoyl-CoA reductase/2-hydroxyglutaryl-CoA dehydratase subunit BcrC/BadD/HgdB